MIRHDSRVGRPVADHGFGGICKMKIFYGNANFNPARWEGSATHISEIIAGLTACGVRVVVNTASPVQRVERHLSGRAAGLCQLKDCDFAYYRFHGFLPERQYPLDRRATRCLSGLRIVWEVNTAIVVDGGVDEDLEIPDVEQLQRQYGAAAADVNAAICNTDGLAQFARDLGIRHVRKIPLGSNPTHFSRRKDIPHVLQALRRDLNVVWIGSAGIRWHDFQTMARAAERLVCEPRIRFFIIGARPSLELPENVYCLGPQSYSDMPRFLSAMDVGLAIYKEPKRSRYGVFSSPLKIFDYLACELAVVASPIGQVQECIRHGENGFVVNFGDDVALSETLRHILAEGNARRRWGLAGRETVETYYNWGRVARETAEFLDQVPRGPSWARACRRHLLAGACSLAKVIHRLKH
jgi:glycosyltransferase involved in cell wall biosynthesis